MKKRFVGIGVATALTMSLGTAGLAFGANITQGDVADDAPSSSNISVSYTEPTSFTVSIPATVELGTAAEVTLSSGYKLPSAKSLIISATAGEFSNGGSESKLDTFTPTKTGEELTVLPGSENTTSKKATFTFAKPSTAKFADTYTGAITFKVEYGTAS